MTISTIKIRSLGVQPYPPIYAAMQSYTERRQSEDEDEIWLLQHPPVFTLGLNGSLRHILQTSDIPVVATDRGGQVTYHGPGQLVAYILIDIKRKNLGVRALITALEQSTVTLLKQYGLSAHAKKEAPGVYLDEAKIASVGLRIKRYCSYHGLSLNVDMDLTPFQFINPCGYEHLKMTQLSDWLPGITLETVQHDLVSILCQNLEYCDLPKDT